MSGAVFCQVFFVKAAFYAAEQLGAAKLPHFVRLFRPQGETAA